MAQVSVNITDFETTPIYTVYDEVNKDAKVKTKTICCNNLFMFIYFSILATSSENMGVFNQSGRRSIARVIHVCDKSSIARIIHVQFCFELSGKSLVLTGPWVKARY